MMCIVVVGRVLLFRHFCILSRERVLNHWSLLLTETSLARDEVGISSSMDLNAGKAPQVSSLNEFCMLFGFFIHSLPQYPIFSAALQTRFLFTSQKSSAIPSGESDLCGLLGVGLDCFFVCFWAKMFKHVKVLNSILPRGTHFYNE